MPRETTDGVFRALKRGEVATVYYLHGPEDALKAEVVRAVLSRALDPSLRDFNLDQRSAAQLDAETVLTLCRTPPMMADRRVVVIRDVEAWKRRTAARAAVLRYLERPAPDVTLVLVQGTGEAEEDRELAARAVAVRCEPLPPERAARWVLHRAGELGLAMEPEAADHLVRVAGADLGPLAVELEKLAALADQGPVTAERVAAVVGVRRGETAHDWRDAVMEDDAARATALLAPVLAQPGATGVRLVTLLGTTLIGVGAARAALERQGGGPRLETAMFELLLRARPYGLLPYREEARRWARWAARWTGPRIADALRAALAADVALKSTTVSDERGILLDLVLSVTVPYREAA